MTNIAIIIIFCLSFILISYFIYKKNGNITLFIFRLILAIVIFLCAVLLLLFYFSFIDSASFSNISIVLITIANIIFMIYILRAYIKPRGKVKTIFIINVLLFFVFLIVFLLKRFFNLNIPWLIIAVFFTLWIVSIPVLFIAGKNQINLKNYKKVQKK